MDNARNLSPLAPVSGYSRGFTLVEMLVAMTLGLLITAAIGYIYIGSLQTYRNQEALSRLQENSRFAFELLSRDIRMAGFGGCGYDEGNTANVLEDPGWYSGLNTLPLIGREGSNGLPAYLPSALTAVMKANTDALTILHGDTDSQFRIETHDVPSAVFKLAGTNHDLVDGEVVVVCGPGQDGETHMTIMQVTNASSTNVTINHNAGTGTPGNCTKCLGSPVDCSAAPVCNQPTDPNYLQFQPGATVMRMTGVTYYIRLNPAGEPALYRENIGTTGNPTLTTAEELVEGVEDMQILYGVDGLDIAGATVAPDGAVDSYQVANVVDTSAALGANREERWRRVLSVKISLLMRTQDDGITPTAQKYQYNGSTVTATDKRLRRVLTHVIKVRNR